MRHYETKAAPALMLSRPLATVGPATQDALGPLAPALLTSAAQHGHDQLENVPTSFGSKLMTGGKYTMRCVVQQEEGLDGVPGPRLGSAIHSPYDFG